MKMPAILKRDPASVLATARAKRAEIEAKLAELAAARADALVESDDVDTAVRAIDDQIADASRTKAVLDDRVAALALVIRERQAEEAEQARQAGIAVIAKRLERRVDLAKKLDGILREFETTWHQLLDRSAVIAEWPAGVPLPGGDALLDVRPIRDELAWRLYACGRPAWNRVCSVPPPKPAVGVVGLEPKGIVGATEAMGQGLLARLRHTRIQPPDNEAEAAA